MQYEVTELKEIKAAGFTARTNNSSPEMCAVIGAAWQKLFSEDGYATIPRKATGKTLGIYTGYENNEHGDYTFMAGCAVNGDVPAGFEECTIPAGKYAKFIVTGNMMTAVGEFWQKLWQMPLERTYTADFEEYQNADPDNCEIHIYIGIK